MVLLLSVAAPKRKGRCEPKSLWKRSGEQLGHVEKGTSRGHRARPHGRYGCMSALSAAPVGPESPERGRALLDEQSPLSLWVVQSRSGSCGLDRPIAIPGRTASTEAQNALSPRATTPDELRNPPGKRPRVPTPIPSARVRNPLRLLRARSSQFDRVACVSEHENSFRTAEIPCNGPRQRALGRACQESASTTCRARSEPGQSSSITSRPALRAT